jgi:epoxyqueuosine reductase
VESCDVKAELSALAAQLGFAVCRVARCGVPPHAREFGEWLDDGRHGEMAWMERNRERRGDPQAVLPGARSVVVVAMNYWQGEGEEGKNTKNRKNAAPSSHSSHPSHPSYDPANAAGASRGVIARYAWGDDYHELLEAKLDELDRFLTARGGVQKRYVDTGPVLERDFAALAGVGWQDKSTMLISPKLGGWFFLAELLTTLDLEPDEPQAHRCGSCTRCITACPSGAITAPYQLDARRCISYLTIELKGSIPEELRPLIGDRIYGCDDCTAACPWNRFASASTEAAFAARAHVHTYALRDYLALDDEQFRALFRKSPIKRIKRRGFLRNVCVALGNVGTVDDLPALRRAAGNAEPLIAEHAAWAIARIEERLTPPPPAGGGSAPQSQSPRAPHTPPPANRAAATAIDR